MSNVKKTPSIMSFSSPLDGAPGERIPRWCWLLLIAITLATMIPGSATMPLLDRDEPRFSRATVEMEQRGTWVVPYFNDEYRFDKPPLTYWWMRINYAVFGHNELGARMHSILSTGIIALLLLAMGRDMFGWRAGFWAAVGWLTTCQVWQHGRLAVADMPMVLSLVLAHWAVWKLITTDSWRRWGLWFWILWGALSMGFLAKGPLVFFSVIFTLLLLRFVLWRKPIPWERFQILPGFALCLVPIAAWGLPALAQTGGLFWNEGMERHVVERGLGAFNDRMTIPVIFYIGTALISLFPWLGRVGTLGVAFKERKKDLRAAFLLAWAIGPYLIFAFYATQLPHYVLPGFPAIMLLFFALPAMGGKWARRWFIGYQALFFAIALAIASWATFGGVYPPAVPMLDGLAAVLMGMSFTAINFESRKTVRVALGIAMIALGASLVAVGMHKNALSPQIAHIANHAKGRLAAVGYTEPSLVYYSGRSWHMYSGKGEGLEEALLGKPAMLIVLRNQLNTNQMLGFDGKNPTDTASSQRAQELLQENYLHTSAEGLNIARFSWATVDIYISMDAVSGYVPEK